MSKPEKPSIHPKVADHRAAQELVRQEKNLWLNGHPAKPPGKRRRGSRGVPKVEEAHYALHPVPLLAEWYRRRKISEPMLRAGNRFNAEMHAAHEPNVRCMDLTRVRVDNAVKGGSLFPAGAGNWGSQEIVLGALDACGGINSASGSVLWHIVGFEKSIREWADAHNPFGLDRNEVPGLIYGALERLTRHYGFRERTPEGARQDGGNQEARRAAGPTGTQQAARPVKAERPRAVPKGPKRA